MIELGGRPKRSPFFLQALSARIAGTVGAVL
jgi:hypothetical protein